MTHDCWVNSSKTYHDYVVVFKAYYNCFPSLTRLGALGMSRGFTPRHAQPVGVSGFVVQFNAETLWHFAQCRYPRADSPQILSIRPNVQPDVKLLSPD